MSFNFYVSLLEKVLILVHACLQNSKFGVETEIIVKRGDLISL